MNILSLFDGISCAQLALQRAGIKVNKYFASEIDRHAIKVTENNFPDTIQLGDVTQIKYKNGKLYSQNGEFEEHIDLICAGSPCQSLSFAGKMQGFDGKSGLFYHVPRLIKETSPQFFLLENVKTKKEWTDIISQEMGVEPIYINSSIFSPQKRKRNYWTNISINPILSTSEQVLNDILDLAAPESHYLNNVQINRGIEKNKSQEINGKRMGNVKFPTPRDEKSKCLNTVRIKGDRTMTHIQDEKGIRLLTVNEYERLQTIPVGYTEGISENQRFKCIGNGWTIDVVSHIFKGMINE